MYSYLHGHHDVRRLGYDAWARVASTCRMRCGNLPDWREPSKIRSLVQRSFPKPINHPKVQVEKWAMLRIALPPAYRIFLYLQQASSTYSIVHSTDDLYSHVRSPTIPQPIGVASQFDDPPPQKATLVIVSSISISLMMVCSALQVYSRSFLLRIPFGLEDGKYENLRCRWIQLSNSAASGLAVVVLSTIIYLLYVLIKYYFHQLG